MRRQRGLPPRSPGDPAATWMLGGSGGKGAAENGEMTDAHTEKLGLVVLCSLIETPASGKQRVYYTGKEEVDQLISAGGICRGAGSGYSLWGIRKLAWPSYLER